ncbi:MAG: 4'-phosphopantetheinyl transferase superfamily protein [Deltaproteobacteria bacterium]|nr:4'-phosphopantetheinyl transferase superfamily protein [Deltaproteobacteria bacterium]MBW2360626.1 4'-phosphopantetheinyl transferase superfamily protein [Deltaproteobacteria bacterium]
MGEPRTTCEEAAERGLPREGARTYFVFQDALVPRLRDQLMGLLSEEERGRQRRFIRDSDRDLFLLAHGMLRRVLALHAGVAPQKLRFETGAHGRPELSGPAAVGSLSFNLTHTPGLAACAVANGRAVGVDAEHLAREIDLRAVSARVFSAIERRGLDGLSGEDAREQFFAHWTLKEAYVKALGLGFSLPLRRITTLPTRDGRALLQLEDMEDDASRWTLRTHRAGSQHRIAVALEAGTDAPVTFEELSLA